MWLSPPRGKHKEPIFTNIHQYLKINIWVNNFSEELKNLNVIKYVSVSTGITIKVNDTIKWY